MGLTKFFRRLPKQLEGKFPDIKKMDTFIQDSILHLFSFPLDLLEMSYETLGKRRIFLDKKRTQLQLKEYHTIHEGSLLRTKSELAARTEISTEFFKTNWIKIPGDTMVLFLGVEHDRNFDTVVLKVLWESQIYYIHKTMNFRDFSEDFKDKFEVLL